jgi:hypothetical protein
MIQEPSILEIRFGVVYTEYSVTLGCLLLDKYFLERCH